MSEFVCALRNIEGDRSSGSSCAHAPSDNPGPCTRGIGHQNVQFLFLNTKGEIFHAASGFLSPDDLDKELTFALDVYQAMKRSPAQARAIDADLHVRRLRSLGFSDAEIRQPRNQFFGGSGVFLFGNDQQPQRPNTRGKANQFGFPFAPQGGNFMDQMFAGQSKRTILNDHKFSISHPLMSFKDFCRQPQLLVGNEKTSFSSISNGGASGGKIGQ